MTCRLQSVNDRSSRTSISDRQASLASKGRKERALAHHVHLPPPAVAIGAGDGGEEGLMEQDGEEVGGEGRRRRVVARQAREELWADGRGAK